MHFSLILKVFKRTLYSICKFLSQYHVSSFTELSGSAFQEDEEDSEQGSESDGDYGDISRNKSRVSQMSAVSSLFTDVTDEGKKTRRSHRSKPKTQEHAESPAASRQVTVATPLPPTTFIKYGTYIHFII